MTPERAGRLIAFWVRFYTRGLTSDAAERRGLEIAADVHDHVAFERATGTKDRRIAASIVSRMVRGIPADVLWRRQSKASKASKEKMMRNLWGILAAALVVATIGAAAIVYGEADDSPGLQLIGLIFAAGAVVLTYRTVRSR